METAAYMLLLSSPSLSDFQPIAIGIICKHLSLPGAVDRWAGEMHTLRFQLFKELIEVFGTQFDMNDTTQRARPLRHVHLEQTDGSFSQAQQGKVRILDPKLKTELLIECDGAFDIAHGQA